MKEENTTFTTKCLIDSLNNRGNTKDIMSGELSDFNFQGKAYESKIQIVENDELTEILDCIHGYRG